MAFPLNPSSNLPFMLTDVAVSLNCKQSNAAHFMSFQLSDLLFQKSILSFIPNAHDILPIPSKVHDSSSIDKFLATHESFIFSLLQNNTTQRMHNTMLTGKSIKKQIPSLARKSAVSRNNFNFYPPQQELLLWHCRLGAIWIFSVYKPYWLNHGFLDIHLLKKISTNALLFHLTMACPVASLLDARPASMMNKNTPLQSPKHLVASYQEGLLTSNSLQPGGRISWDQYMSTILGRLQRELRSQLQLHLHDAHSALQLVNHRSGWLFLLSMNLTTTFINLLFQGLHIMSSIPTLIRAF